MDGERENPTFGSQPILQCVKKFDPSRGNNQHDYACLKHVDFTVHHVSVGDFSNVASTRKLKQTINALKLF